MHRNAFDYIGKFDRIGVEFDLTLREFDQVEVFDRIWARVDLSKAPIRLEVKMSESTRAPHKDFRTYLCGAAEIPENRLGRNTGPDGGKMGHHEEESYKGRPLQRVGPR